MDSTCFTMFLWPLSCSLLFWPLAEDKRLHPSAERQTLQTRHSMQVNAKEIEKTSLVFLAWLNSNRVSHSVKLEAIISGIDSMDCILRSCWQRFIFIVWDNRADGKMPMINNSGSVSLYFFLKTRRLGITCWRITIVCVAKGWTAKLQIVLC